MEAELAKMPLRGDSGSQGQGGEKMGLPRAVREGARLPWAGGEMGDGGEREVLPFLQPVNSARKI